MAPASTISMAIYSIIIYVMGLKLEMFWLAAQRMVAKVRHIKVAREGGGGVLLSCDHIGGSMGFYRYGAVFIGVFDTDGSVRDTPLTRSSRPSTASIARALNYQVWPKYGPRGYQSMPDQPYSLLIMLIITIET